MIKKTLICTVGGSHRPIVKAIESTKADFVCFVCSDDDLTTGNKGSYTQILDKGLCIKSSPKDDKPSLPNIPEQVGLEERQYTIIRVQPDNLTNVYEQIQHWIGKSDFDSQSLVADYTGGTKTMTAGLVMVALKDNRIQLNLIAGPRSDLRQVRADHGSATRASIENLRIQQQLHEVLMLWQHHGYAEAAQLSHEIINPQDAQLLARLEQVRGASKALADWDCFRHEEALERLEIYRTRFSTVWTHLYNLLNKLAARDEATRELHQLFDLWRNAQRRGFAGRFDDAVSRWYRLVEGCAQWILKSHSGIDTADVPPEMISQEMGVHPDKNGKFKVASSNAWKLAAIHGPAPAQNFWAAEKTRLPDYLQLRNHSILAHGFLPISKKDWIQLDDWASTTLIPLMFSFAQKNPYRLKDLPSQLPTEFPL